MNPYEGLHARRKAKNPREKAFAKAWEKINENSLGDTTLLDDLLSTDRFSPKPSERDYQVAATLIQWLGSHVGQCFLSQVEEETPPGDGADWVTKHNWIKKKALQDTQEEP
jgi:hypothetical protein